MMSARQLCIVTSFGALYFLSGVQLLGDWQFPEIFPEKYISYLMLVLAAFLLGCTVPKTSPATLLLYGLGLSLIFLSVDLMVAAYQAPISAGYHKW